MKSNFYPFMLEREMGIWEHQVAYNLSESGVHPMSTGELLQDDPKLIEELLAVELNYPQTNGTLELRQNIAAIYPGAKAEDVLATSGAAQANFTAILTTLDPGDEIVVMLPNYMQIWGTAKNLGLKINTFSLREELGWGFDLDEFRQAVTPKTKLIAVCNPNNPTGHIMTEEERRAVLSAAAEVGAWLLEFKQASLNGLRTLDEIDAVALPGDAPSTARGFESLVAASEGMREEDTRALLDVLDPEEFQQLSLRRTADLLGEEVSEEETRRRLAEMSPSEAIAAAAYFARSRLQAYASPEMQMEDLLEAGSEADTLESWLQVGDCKHFAGLTVHYLNHVVKPLNPRLAHWYFGVQVTHMQDYHHAYVKTVHVGADGESLDLFFFDPTVLANYPLRRLKPEKIRRLIEATERNDHYFVLKRYAEDLVRSPLEPDLAFDDLEIDVDGGEGRIDLLPLLRQ